LAERAFLLQVAHRDAALDDIEAARLLDHHAQQRRRRTEPVALDVTPARLRLGDRERAEGFRAALDARIVLGRGADAGERDECSDEAATQ
jgi:hypothetical protein